MFLMCFCSSGFVGLHKVKRDKFSVFNFLSVPESRDTPGNPPTVTPEGIKGEASCFSGYYPSPCVMKVFMHVNGVQSQNPQSTPCSE